jgi:hypothetical protein
MGIRSYISASFLIAKAGFLNGNRLIVTFRLSTSTLQPQQTTITVPLMAANMQVVGQEEKGLPGSTI